jgi:hypothetical protein
MSGATKHAARAAAVAAVLAALGFGSAQALASPATPAAAGVRACDSGTCSTACFRKGYTGWYCWQGVCHCSFDPPPQ